MLLEMQNKGTIKAHQHPSALRARHRALGRSEIPSQCCKMSHLANNDDLSQRFNSSPGSLLKAGEGRVSHLGTVACRAGGAGRAGPTSSGEGASLGGRPEKPWREAGKVEPPTGS